MFIKKTKTRRLQNEQEKESQAYFVFKEHTMKTLSALFFLLLSGLVNCRPQRAETHLAAILADEERSDHFIVHLTRLQRQILQESTDDSTATSTRLPPANPEITTVYKVSCDCPFTQQYTPVCGSDGQNYGNSQILNCARFCGVNVTMVYPTACGSNRG